MKVLTEQTVRFAVGETAAPEDLNKVFLQAQDATADVLQKRFAKSLLQLPYVRAVATPYTQALTAEELTYRFRCPAPITIERCALNANLVTTVAPATISIIKTAGSTTPQGATVPLLSTRGAQVLDAAGVPSVSSSGLIGVATSRVLDRNGDAVTLESDTEYQLTLAGNTFSTTRADVALHLSADRWQRSGALVTPAFSPVLLNDLSARDATVVAANTAALAVQTAKFSAATGLTPIFFCRHGLLPATSASLRTFSIPRYSNTRAKAKIVRIYLWAVMSAAAAAGSVTATLRDETGAALDVVTAVVTGLTFQSADSGVLARSLTTAAAAAAAITSNDYSILLNNSSATNALKVYGLAWVEWS